MNGKPIFRISAFLLLGAMIVPPLGAVDNAEIREISVQAQRLQEAGEWARSEALLRQTLSRCDRGEEGRGCRLRMHFSLGYLYQRRQELSAQDQQTGKEFLEKAEGYYRRVLAEAPGHVATRRNLALVYKRSGDREALLRFLRTSIEAVAGQQGEFAALLAKQYRLGGDWRQAQMFYELASEQNSDDESLRLGIVASFAKIPAADMAALFKRSKQWADRFPTAAAAGCRTIVESKPGDSRLVDDAFELLTTILADRPSLLQKTLAELPAESKTKPIAWLEVYLKNPESPSSPHSWWLDGNRRRDLLARVALAAGKDLLVGGKTSETEACWRWALKASPALDAYAAPNLRDQNLTRLDLQTELAALYYKHPELDSSGEKFARIERALFKGKGQSYRGNDLEAIYRYHIVLGNIYALRGQWESPDYAHNGIFQLDHALKIGRKIERETGQSKTSPEVMTLLAGGYAKTGRINRAYTLYLDAAETSLKTGNQALATKNLVSSLDLGFQAPQPLQTRFRDIAVNLNTSSARIHAEMRSHNPTLIEKPDARAIDARDGDRRPHIRPTTQRGGSYRIAGKVTNEAGRAIAQAIILIIPKDKKLTRTQRLETSRGGNFAITLPKTGEYRIRITAKGYAQVERNVRVHPGASKKMRFVLKPLKKRP